MGDTDRPNSGNIARLAARLDNLGLDSIAAGNRRYRQNVRKVLVCCCRRCTAPRAVCRLHTGYAARRVEQYRCIRHGRAMFGEELDWSCLANVYRIEGRRMR